MNGSFPPQAFGRSLWAQTAAQIPPLGPLQGEVRAEVAIVGGGYSGLSAALHLAEAGKAVVLIEAQEPGFGASGRNAAGWLPVYLDKTPDMVEALLGEARGQALNAMVAESGRLVPELAERHGIDAAIAPSGVLLCSDKDADAAGLAAIRALWNDRGGNIDAVDPAQLPALTGSSAFRHGVHFRAAGTLNPLGFARGLAAAALRAGAGIHCGAEALRIISDPAGWRVETAQGALVAPRVLIATEGYNANRTLWPGLEKTVYHLPMAMIASRPAPGLVRRILPAGIPIADANKANPFWTMADADGRIVASLLPPFGDRASPAQVARAYEAKLRRIYGDLPPIDWANFWIGTVAVSAERIPRLLALASGVHAIGGYSGQGIGAATAAGREYARLVDGGGDEAACRLPVLKPASVPLGRLFPAAFPKILAPLSRALDRSYRNLPT